MPAPVAQLGRMSLTRLFLCRDDIFPSPDNPRLYIPREVKLWTPVPGGPFAQASLDLESSNDQVACFQSTRALPAGVWCLHTNDWDDPNRPPTFSTPFIVQGYEQPAILETKVTLQEGKATLLATVVNKGKAEFRDGLLVVTVQKREGSRSRFSGRENCALRPIPAGEKQQTAVEFDTTQWTPGEYYFLGHVNYRFLYDSNRLDNFESTAFQLEKP